MNQELLENPYALAPSDVARVFDRAAPTYARSAVVADVTRAELLDRLEVLTVRPDVVLDAGCGDGQALAPLAQRYPQARIIGVDVSPAMLARAARGAENAGVAPELQCGDLHELALPAASVDLVFCNLVLPWCFDTERVIAQLRRVLKPDGVLHFATLGPDTLKELTRAFRGIDRAIHVHYFYDMHDVGDALARAGFAEPVMDAEPLTLTYETLASMHRDLRESGQQNIARDRARGLMARPRFARFEAALEVQRRDGRLPLSYELVYGQAFATERRPNKVLPDGDIAVPFEDLGVRGR